MGERSTPLRRVGELVSLAAVTLIVLYLYGAIDYAVPPFSGWDLRSYLSMSEAAPGLAPSVHRPFCYRLLGPYVVGLLPLAEPAGFLLITWFSTLALVLLFHGYLASQRVSRLTCWVVSLFFVLNRNLVGYSVWNYFQVNDTLSLVFLVLLLRSLVDRRWIVWGLTLLLGAATRETALLMIPVACAYLWDRGQLREQWRSLSLASLPGVLLFLALRWFVPAGGGPSLYQAFLLHSRKLLSVESWFRLLISPFLPLSFLPLIYPRRTWAFALAHRHLLVLGALVFASALFGENNERLVSPAFLLFYPLIAQIIDDRLGKRKGLLAIVAISAIAASLHHQSARYPLPTRTATVFLSLGSVALVSTVCLGNNWRSRIEGHPSG